MNTLESLGMKKNWLYEVVVSLYDGQVSHAAPFGAKTNDFKTVIIEMYKGSNTLRNVLAGKEFALNAVDDPAIFYNALYCREKIQFESAKMITAPVLFHSPSSIEVRLKAAKEKEKSYLLESEVVHIHTRNKGELTNRAQGLVLESLILSTRRSMFPVKELEKMLTENDRVIKKVAPGSKYEKIMHDLLIDCLGEAGPE